MEVPGPVPRVWEREMAVCTLPCPPPPPLLVMLWEPRPPLSSLSPHPCETPPAQIHPSLPAWRGRWRTDWAWLDQASDMWRPGPLWGVHLRRSLDMSPSSGPAEIRLCHLTGWAHSQEAALAPTATLSEAAGCRDQASEEETDSRCQDFRA